MKKTCSKCGFHIQIFNETPRGIIKGLREHIVTAKLFGCSECVELLKKKLEEVQ